MKSIINPGLGGKESAFGGKLFFSSFAAIVVVTKACGSSIHIDNCFKGAIEVISTFFHRAVWIADVIGLSPMGVFDFCHELIGVCLFCGVVKDVVGDFVYGLIKAKFS